MFAGDYDNDRHFFLSQYFGTSDAKKTIPCRQVQITRIEVWVTNKYNASNNIRNIIALQDLGEGRLTGLVMKWLF
jgi:cell surface protein SprA